MKICEYGTKYSLWGIPYSGRGSTWSFRGHGTLSVSTTRRRVFPACAPKRSAGPGRKQATQAAPALKSATDYTPWRPCLVSAHRQSSRHRERLLLPSPAGTFVTFVPLSLVPLTLYGPHHSASICDIEPSAPFSCSNLRPSPPSLITHADQRNITYLDNTLIPTLMMQ